jgi:exopolyphosphatase/guanosine-5'-triphosphate,3'-diphosphate pyrophosphatase
MRVAGIDVGSNSVRLLVADVGTGVDAMVSTVARAGEACRLGKGLERSGRIEREVAERAAALVAEFARRANSLGALRTVVGATAALRTASNGLEVGEIITARTGLPVRILTGDEEARLVYRAVVEGLGTSARRNACVVFDLGGGEIVSGVGTGVGRWASLPFGAVSLTEKHAKHDPMTSEEAVGITAEVEGYLMHECALMPAATAVLAGVGGTVTVLASLDRGLIMHEPSLIDGWLIQGGRLAQLIRQLVESSTSDRDRMSILGSGRADIVVAGALVVEAIARRFPSRGVCSTQGSATAWSDRGGGTRERRERGRSPRSQLPIVKPIHAQDANGAGQVPSKSAPCEIVLHLRAVQPNSQWWRAGSA